MKKATLLFLASYLVIAGCSLMEINRKIDQTEKRIATKQKERRKIEKSNQQLLTEKEKLVTDLKQNKITLEQLYYRLNKVIEENSRLNDSITIAQRKIEEEKKNNLMHQAKKIEFIVNNHELTSGEKEQKFQDMRRELLGSIQRFD